MSTSDNGWPGIPDRNDTAVITVPGTDRKLRVAPATAWVFMEFTGRFNAEVEPIEPGQLDDWGYAWRNVRGSSSRLSCHASGTAVDLNALKHPRGVRGTFSASQLKALRALLADFEGVIKWGGDFRSPSLPDEMHFQINGNKADVSRIRLKLTEQKTREDDVSFRDRHVLTDADVEAYGQEGLDAGKDEKSYDELVRFPPATARLRREMNARLDRIEKALAELAKARK